MKIPFLSFATSNEQIRSEIFENFQKFFDSKYYILGNGVAAFEKSFAAYSNTEHCVGVSNGLDALFLSLKVLGVGPGDEVIIPSNTYIATALAVSYCGATPVFTEPDPESYNIDPSNFERSITSRTKAVIPVHLYGQCCAMEQIMEIAARQNIFVVEDNAQAQGASFNNKPTGSFGTVNGISFYPGKNLGAFGDAGAITTNSAEIAEKVRVLRNYGSQKKYYNEVIGYNMRLDELQAVLLSVKLKYLDGWNKERQQIAEWYTQRLSRLEGIILPFITPGASHVFHQYVIRTEKRNKLQEHLQNNGIGTLIHYPVPPHLQNAYKDLGYKKGDFPVAELIADTCLSLPIYPGLTESEAGYVCEIIESFFK